MILGFSVKNFRSFKDESSVSFLASNYYKENSDTLLNAAIPGLSGVEVLPVTALYGPNASGKSTLIAAVQEMRNAILSLPNNLGDTGAFYQPFALDKDSDSQPTSFAIEFCTNRLDEGDALSKVVRYLYSFSYSQSGIIDEELSAYFTKMPRKLFTRHVDESGVTIIEGSETFPIPNDIKQYIGNHILVISFFSQSGLARAGKEARVVSDWFKYELTVVNRGPGANPAQMFSGDILDGTSGTELQRMMIRQIMKKADAGLNGVEVERTPISDSNLPDEMRNMLAPDILKSLEGRFLKSLIFKHQGSEDVFRVPTESEGTLQLFALSGYVAQALELGTVLLIDELDASLHPELGIELINMFLDREINKNGAQLIFTAHNPCLMNGEKMRRDEFWITKKDEEGVSDLYPISDFKARKGESIQSAYMQGKYAGLPMIPKCFGLCVPKQPKVGNCHAETE